jgi:protein involved in polysaccharide export with SLBB domain
MNCLTITLQNNIKTLMYLCMLVAMTNLVVAQIRTGSDRTEEPDMLLPTKSPTTSVQSPGVALESTVDPEKYYVGPSDVLAVNVWTSPPINLTLTVTPEGTLIIPTVGEIVVAEMLLSRAKERVVNEVRKKYISGQVSVTLIRPRPIIVTIHGSVLNPGLYIASAVDRANKVLDQANTPSRTQSQTEASLMIEQMSRRNIFLKRRDGTEQRVDLVKFLAMKDDRWNPYLREGDVLIVPRKNPDKNVFGIYGEVNAPGKYEHVEGDSVLDALRIAAGFTRLAVADSVEFSRLSADGSVLSMQAIDLKAISEGRKPNMALESGDRLAVKPRIDLREDYTVYVGGEVLYPGTYPITKNRTRLSEVIYRAGGFTDFAMLEIAELNRRSVLPADIQLERLVSLKGGVSAEDSTYYLLETDLRLQKEIVNVDFHELFEHHDSTQDVILQSGDYIVIPSKKKTVYVFGQVVSAGHTPFVEGEGVEYYLKKAGGLTGRARRDDIKIIKAKTRQWLSANETTIETGDYVWVPQEIERSFGYYMAIIGQTAAVLSIALSIVLLVLQTNN